MPFWGGARALPYDAGVLGSAEPHGPAGRVPLREFRAGGRASLSALAESKAPGLRQIPDPFCFWIQAWDGSAEALRRAQAEEQIPSLSRDDKTHNDTRQRTLG